MFTTLHTLFETQYTELALALALAVAASDDATADLGIRRIQPHEKNAWMLESHLAWRVGGPLVQLPPLGVGCDAFHREVLARDE